MAPGNKQGNLELKDESWASISVRAFFRTLVQHEAETLFCLDCDKFLRNLRCATAAGPSGMTMEHLKAAAPAFTLGNKCGPHSSSHKCRRLPTHRPQKTEITALTPCNIEFLEIEPVLCRNHFNRRESRFSVHVTTSFSTTSRWTGLEGCGSNDPHVSWPAQPLPLTGAGTRSWLRLPVIARGH